MKERSKEPQKTLEQTIKEVQEMARERQPLYDLLDRIRAQREADHAAVLAMRNKNELTKSELMQLYKDEKRAIEKLTGTAQCALEEVNEALNAPPQKKTKRAPAKMAYDDLAEMNIDPMEMAALAVKEALNFAWHVRQHLNEIERAIMKL